MTAEPLRGHVTNQADRPDLRDCLFRVDREIGAITCEVEGEIRAGLRGQVVRNGPNQMFEAAGKYHTFDGDGMLHGVTFEEGRAVYRNRWIRTRGLEAEIALGRPVYPRLSELMNFPGIEERSRMTWNLPETSRSTVCFRCSRTASAV